jgi:hypothetical protein
MATEDDLRRLALALPGAAERDGIAEVQPDEQAPRRLVKKSDAAGGV